MQPQPYTVVWSGGPLLPARPESTAPLWRCGYVAFQTARDSEARNHARYRPGSNRCVVCGRVVRPDAIETHEACLVRLGRRSD